MDAVVRPARCTQKQALAEARAIIDRYRIEQPFSPSDLARLSELSGTELRYVIKRKNPTFPSDNRHLHVLAYDWMELGQWSWNQAIKIAFARSPAEAIESRRRGKLLFALRRSIQADLNDFRCAQADQCCARCGSPDTLTTDHVAPPFIRIALDFIASHPDIPLTKVQGDGDRIAFVDVEAEWIAFHASRAVYQLLCRSCNSAKGQK